jgi:hypothetical protein
MVSKKYLERRYLYLYPKNNAAKRRGREEYKEE